MTDRLLSPQELAAYFGVPTATIYKMNSEGTAPRRIRVGRHVRYRLSDCERWLTDHAVDGTSRPG